MCLINPYSLADGRAQKSKDFRYVIRSVIGRSCVGPGERWVKESLASDTDRSPQTQSSSYLTSLQLVLRTSIWWADNHLNSGTGPQYLLFLLFVFLQPAQKSSFLTFPLESSCKSLLSASDSEFFLSTSRYICVILFLDYKFLMERVKSIIRYEPQYWHNAWHGCSRVGSKTLICS